MRPLEIDWLPRPQRAQRRHASGLRSDVRRPSRRRCTSSPSGRHRSPQRSRPDEAPVASGVRIVSVKPDAVGTTSADDADRFNEAGEHILRSAHPARAARPCRSISDGGRKRATLEQRHAAISKPHGRHVELDVVHDAFVPGRRVHASPAFEHQALHVEIRQHRQCGSDPRPRHRNQRAPASCRASRPLGPERLRRCEYYHRSRREGRKQARRRRRAQPAVEDTRASGRSR